MATLAFSAGFAASETPTQHRHSRRHSHRSKTQLQGALAAIRDKKAQVRKQLHETRHQAKVVKKDLEVVDNELTDVKHKLNETKSNLADSRAEQRRVAAQLKEANRQLALTRVQVRARLRKIYMQGHGSAFSAVVGTHSAGELASRGSIMTSIERKDRDLFNHYTQLQKEVSDEKREQDAVVARIGRLAARERGETIELAGVREEKGEVLQGLRVKQGELQELLQQFEQDEQDISAQIRAYNRGAGRRSNLPAFVGRFSRPVDAPITSGFGYRYHPILHYTRLHAGIDFGAPMGTPIHAAADGDVIAVRTMSGYGLVVMIDHGGGISTVYAHTSQTFVSAGQHVKRGEAIAAVGMSGLATGPHLHFEVRVNGRPVNPLGRL